MTDERQPTGIGFALRDPYPWDDLVGLARAGESLGFDTLFLPEITSRDTLAAITGLGGETTRLRLGTGVVPMPSRAPQLLAMAAATAQERSGGRLVLGLGTGPAIPGSLDRLGALVRALREVFSKGEVTGTDRLELSLPLPAPIPIWIAALGPRAVRLAGSTADGVLLNWCTPARVARAVEELREGAASAQRDPDEIAVAVYVRAALDGSEASIASVRRAAGEYAGYPAYARQFASLGLGEEARVAADALGAGRPDDVPDALVDAVCLRGDRAHAAERLREYREAGADLVVVYPITSGARPASSALATLEALAPSNVPSTS